MTNEMTICDTIILGIVTSFVASIIFTFLFTRLKPDLKISPVIGYSNGSFKIKVINESCFAVINIKAELSYISYFNVPGGRETNSTHIPLALQNGELFDIDKFEINSEFATYSYRFKTTEDIQQGLTLNNRQYIRLKISATHSLSNMGKVFLQNYTRDKIIEGEYPFGENLDIPIIA